MAYKKNNNDFIIDPEVENDEQPIVQKEMESVPINEISRDYEIVEEEERETPQSVLEEIRESAREEGLVDDNEAPLGGEDPTAESIIEDLKTRGLSKGAQEKKEKHEEEQMKKNRKIMATRDILTGMTKRTITVTIPVVLDVKQPDGSAKPELCDMDITIRRLTESQFNHLVNRRIASKKLQDMTPEEYEQDNHFRSNYLAETVIEPQLTAEEWYNDVPNNVSASIFSKVQEMLSEVDDVSLFQ